MWEIDLYETPGGKCPAQEFLDGLQKTELPFVEYKIDLLMKNGNLLDFPHTKYLRDGIFELRISVGHKQFRLLYFFFYNEKIIISHGIRKEKKVPPGEIDKAVKHKEDYFSRHNRKKI